MAILHATNVALRRRRLKSTRIFETLAPLPVLHKSDQTCSALDCISKCISNESVLITTAKMAMEQQTPTIETLAVSSGLSQTMSKKLSLLLPMFPLDEPADKESVIDLTAAESWTIRQELLKLYRDSLSKDLDPKVR